MNIQINNLGPIKNGKIPLNADLLFFVGFNNSGKSYATQLIWALYNQNFREKFIEELKLNKITRVQKIENFVFDEAIAIKLITEFEKYIKNKIHTLYNLEREKFVNFNIKFELKENELTHIIENEGGSFSIAKGTDENIKKITIHRDVSSKKISIDGSINDIDLETLKKKIIEFYFFNILGGSHSFFLPAIRGAYVNLFQYINRYEKEKKDKINEYMNDDTKVELNEVIRLIRESNSSYTRATNYLIESLTELSPESVESTKYIDFQKTIVEIMGGEITKKSSKVIGNSKFYLNLGDKELPMHISSSTTNQLAPLYLFFKYWGHDVYDDMLIIDEPEENLHPSNQVKFLDMMFKFVAKGNKALITSHSPLLTKLLNSHIAFNELNEENKKKIQEETEFVSYDFINKENVKVCFFNGEEILSYPVTEYGTMFKDFISVEDKINNQFRTITNQLFEQNE